MFVILMDDGTPTGGPQKTGLEALHRAVHMLAMDDTLPEYHDPAVRLDRLFVWLPEELREAKALVLSVDWAIFEVSVYLGGANDEDPDTLYSYFER